MVVGINPSLPASDKIKDSFSYNDTSEGISATITYEYPNEAEVLISY
ncbi:hypothetical protein [Flexithrix dorotheae]|nr:hypothetical protein [Flexithrix dorotheae]